MKKYLFALLLLALFWTGCDDFSTPTLPAAYINVSPTDDSEFTSTGGSRTITFDTNYKWTASTRSSWVSLSPQSGNAGIGTLTVTVADNASIYARVDTTYIASEDADLAPYRIITKQAGRLLAIDRDAIGFDKSGGRESIVVTTDGTYEVRTEPEATWLSCKKDGNTVTVEAASNTEATVRTAKVIISLSGVPAEEQKESEKTITVSQESGEACLTFTCEGLQTITIQHEVQSLEYSVGGSEWKELKTDVVTFGGDSGDFRLRGKCKYGTSNVFEDIFPNANPIIFGNNNKVKCKGDIRTLVNYENVDADCSNARFRGLFINCRQLISAPSLPIKKLASYCYSLLFQGCTSLTTAPELPATELAEDCYCRMFYGCTSLNTAPDLPATIMENGCYYGMFEGCTSLATAPDLPSTIMKTGCYNCMFFDCTSLTTAPDLPAMTLSSSCYCKMFAGCTSLTTAPSLPATTLVIGCYSSMFEGCTSLTTAPSLPATTLEHFCYQGMFLGCTSLITAPDLPATTLVLNCYHSIFKGCTKLNYVKMLAIDASYFDNCPYWLDGVSSKGTFVKNKDAKWSVNGMVPLGWKVITE